MGTLKLKTWILRICAVAAFAATTVAVFLVSDHLARRWELSLVRDISLNDADGHPWTVASLGDRVGPGREGGQIGIIYFGYTYCPDVCPTALNTLAIALDDLGPAADNFRPVFVSVDPDRDTPAMVRDYAAQFSPRITGLTGPPDKIADFARAFGVTYVIRKSDTETTGDYIIDHTANFFLVTAAGNRVPLPYTDDSDKLVEMLKNARERLGE